jgi:hypothetical protein
MPIGKRKQADADHEDKNPEQANYYRTQRDNGSVVAGQTPAADIGRVEAPDALGCVSLA